MLHESATEYLPREQQNQLRPLFIILQGTTILD